MDVRRTLSGGEIALAVVMIVAAVILGLAHLAFAGFACSGDTSECARSVEKDGYYEGTLHRLDGRPYRSAEFEVRFASRKSDSPVTFETDASGHACIRWAEERVYPDARTPTGEPLYGIDKSVSELAPWHELGFFGAPRDCQESGEGVPWNHADDLESTWQSRLLIILPLAAIGFLAAALIGRRSRHAGRLFATGGLLFGADLIAFVVLWFG